MMKFKNIAIPSVLLSIVLVAGIFAFIPVQDASTVHSQIEDANVGKVVTSGTVAAPRNAEIAAGETEVLTCTADYRLISIMMDIGGTAGDIGDGDNVDVTIDSINVSQTATAEFSNEIIGDGFGGQLVGQGTDERVITVTFRDAGNQWDDGDEVLETIRASYISSGTCTWN